MENYTVERDNEPALTFSGEKIASVSSYTTSNATRWRWTELTLYRTQGGRYVCEQVGRTRWQGEHTRHAATIADDTAGVIEFFGHGWLAKDLYDEAHIDASEHVD